MWLTTGCVPGSNMLKMEKKEDEKKGVEAMWLRGFVPCANAR